MVQLICIVQARALALNAKGVCRARLCDSNSNIVSSLVPADIVVLQCPSLLRPISDQTTAHQRSELDSLSQKSTFRAGELDNNLTTEFAHHHVFVSFESYIRREMHYLTSRLDYNRQRLLQLRLAARRKIDQPQLVERVDARSDGQESHAN